MTQNKHTSLEWRKLKPREGDEHHWMTKLLPIDIGFDIYEINGKYLTKITWEEYTKDISWFDTLEAAKQGAEDHLEKSFIKTMKWISS